MKTLGTTLITIGLGSALLTGVCTTSAAAQPVQPRTVTNTAATTLSASMTVSIPDSNSDAARAVLLRTLPTVQSGNSGSDVLAVQIGLRYRGAKYLRGTGYFGSLTTKAVKEFQRERGLTVDGVVGPRTWEALIPRATGAPYRLENPQLLPGQLWPVDARGESVFGYLSLGLRRLNDLTAWSPRQSFETPARYDGSQVVAVRELQRRAGLTPSGILGARTTRVMLLISTVTGGFGN